MYDEDLHDWLECFGCEGSVRADKAVYDEAGNPWDQECLDEIPHQMPWLKGTKRKVKSMIYLSTERADRETFEAGARAAYRAAKLPEPERIVWTVTAAGEEAVRS